MIEFENFKNSKIYKNFVNKGEKLPDKYVMENKNTWIHDQGDKPTCVLHSWAYVEEARLAHIYKQRVIIDVDEIWDRMVSIGLGNDNGTNFRIAIEFICSTYFIFQTEDGIKYWWLGNKVGKIWEETRLIEEGVLENETYKVVPKKGYFEAFIDVMGSDN